MKNVICIAVPLVMCWCLWLSYCCTNTLFYTSTSF